MSLAVFFLVSAPAANVVWVGIENPAKGNYSIFPNPSSGEARINSPCNMERVEVYSVSGKLVQRFDKINQQSFELKLREPAKGLFIVKIFSCEGLHRYPGFWNNQRFCSTIPESSFHQREPTATPIPLIFTPATSRSKLSV
ncbi:MAG: T9SS type A sorting domain-containing protein [Bacteroidia bacterium]